MREDDIRMLLQDYADKRQISQSNVVAFFLYVRKTMEAYDLQRRYPVLWTYCNWNAHIGLNRPDHKHILVCLVRRLLPRPPEEFIQTGSGYSNVVVDGGLRIRELRYELRWFLERVGVSFRPLDDEPLFRGFVVALLHSLVDMPLTLNMNLVSSEGNIDGAKVFSVFCSNRFLGKSVCFVVKPSKKPENLGNPMLCFWFNYLDSETREDVTCSYDVWDLTLDPVSRV